MIEERRAQIERGQHPLAVLRGGGVFVPVLDVPSELSDPDLDAATLLRPRLPTGLHGRWFVVVDSRGRGCKRSVRRCRRRQVRLGSCCLWGGVVVAVPGAWFELSGWWEAIESRDAASQVPLYAENAMLQVVNPDHPPRSPMVFKSRKAIASWIDDVCALNMTHKVVDVVDGGNRVSLTEEGRYADGAGVWSMSTVFFEDGLIVRQRMVLVWDGFE